MGLKPSERKIEPSPFVTRLLPMRLNPSPHRSSELFLGNIATNWPVSATDQSSVNTFRSLDLQIGGIAASSTSISVPMKHKMGVVKITLGTKSVPTTRTYSASGTQPADATGMKYTDSSEKTTVTASSSFDTSCKPYTSDGYWYIVRGSTTSNTYTKTFKSVTTVNTDWEYANVSVNQGAYLNIIVNNSYIKRLCYKFIALFSCTQTVQTYTFLYSSKDFIYAMECWGGQGGNMGTSTYNGKGIGGLGGYTLGETIKNTEKYFASGSEVYVYVGGSGVGWNSTSLNAGGWNGGGTVYAGASGGGGGTDIRLTKASTTDNTIWYNFASLKSRIMVAAGGGGSNDFDKGGHGGNETGETGAIGSSGTPGTGGTQKTGGSNYGRFGYSYYPGTSPGDGGGGGGGYFGGGRATGNYSCGGGGSSYISGHPGCNGVNNSTKAHLGASQSSVIGGTTYTFTDTEMIDGDGYKWTSASETREYSSATVPGLPKIGSTTATKTTVPTKPTQTNANNGFCVITLTK